MCISYLLSNVDECDEPELYASDDSASKSGYSAWYGRLFIAIVHVYRRRFKFYLSYADKKNIFSLKQVSNPLILDLCTTGVIHIYTPFVVVIIIIILYV